MIAGKSVILGKMGEIKQVVRTPTSWKAFMVASLRSMLTALSISFLNCLSSVLVDHDTYALGKVLIRSRSRSTKSDFVAILTVQPLSYICSSRVRVRQAVSSSGWYGSQTEPINSSFSAYSSGFLISGQCYTSTNCPKVLGDW